MRILVVEDEPSLNRLIVQRLQKEHYTVDACLDGSAALDCLRCAEYDGVVLDVMLPGISGLDVLRRLRAGNSTVPVLLLTALGSVENRVGGLDAGADDYLVKPFAMDELLARIRVMVRRLSGGVSSVFTVADLIVDCDARTVTRGGELVALASREFDVLEYLIRNRGTVLSREKIGQHIWNYDYEGGSNVVDVYIRYLRRKLDDGREPKLIHTIRGAGYVLRAEE